mmetsp:Transcript_28341/g.58853  ORF Transcript_28341/g.58853 Transcript_28341/m.58853 type:complete len:208 (-) Transcript_28341:141-764(-)
MVTPRWLRCAFHAAASLPLLPSFGASLWERTGLMSWIRARATAQPWACPEECPRPCSKKLTRAKKVMSPSVSSSWKGLAMTATPLAKRWSGCTILSASPSIKLSSFISSTMTSCQAATTLHLTTSRPGTKCSASAECAPPVAPTTRASPVESRLTRRTLDGTAEAAEAVALGCWTVVEVAAAAAAASHLQGLCLGCRSAWSQLRRPS